MSASAAHRYGHAWFNRTCAHRPQRRVSRPSAVDRRWTSLDVRYDLKQPGTYHYSWVNGPPDGYGFTSGRSDRQRDTLEAHEAHIREFLSAVDPMTGYIEDDGDGN